MSTITSINSTDSGSTSRGVINTNFSNLNTDKAESATVATDIASAVSTHAALQTGVHGLAITSAKTLTVTDNATISGGSHSGTNTGDQTLPVKATGAELDTGTDDAKFSTAKALKDSHNVPSVAPGTSGNVLTSNGTDWTSATPSGGIYKNGVTTYDLTTASGNQTIAHGLGTTPRFIRITVTMPYSNTNIGSTGVYNGTTNSSIYNGYTTIAVAGNSGTNCVYLSPGGSGVTQTATATFDGTNITLAWTKSGSPTGTAYILWEAIG